MNLTRFLYVSLLPHAAFPLNQSSLPLPAPGPSSSGKQEICRLVADSRPLPALSCPDPPRLLTGAGLQHVLPCRCSCPTSTLHPLDRTMTPACGGGTRSVDTRTATRGTTSDSSLSFSAAKRTTARKCDSSIKPVARASGDDTVKAGGDTGNGIHRKPLVSWPVDTNHRLLDFPLLSLSHPDRHPC